MVKRLRFLLINLLVLLILLVLIEGISRLVLQRVYNRSFDSSIIEDNKYISSSGLKANASAKVWGKQFSTDANGCRKTGVPYNSNKKKWLFIGDSVTEGVGVDDASDFPAIVANAVDSFNVLNYSLIGYSVADYLNVLKTVTLNTDSSIGRVTLFFCLNDVYGSSSAGDLPVMQRKNFWGNLNGFFQDRYATYKLIKLYLYENSNRYYQYDARFYRAGDSHFTESMELLKQCKNLCDIKGARFEVVVLPYRSQITGLDDETPQRLILDYCQQNNIAFYDVAAHLAGVPEPSDLYLFADEIHFSEKGHKAMAGYILSL